MKTEVVFDSLEDGIKALPNLHQALVKIHLLADHTYRRYLVDKAADHLARDGVPHPLLQQMSKVLIDEFTCNELHTYDVKSLAYKLGIPKSKFKRKYYDQYKSLLGRFEMITKEAIDQIKHNTG